MARLLTLPLARIEDAAGAPLPNAKLDVFESGTTTPATVYTDSALTTAHANPVVADAGGLLPEIFLDPATVYRFRARTAGGTNIAGMDFDPVAPHDAAEVSYTASATGAVARSVESKLDEIFSVKDFGAKGDGTTNDTDAFTAASAAINAAGGGTLLIPPGTYIVAKQSLAGTTGLGYAYRSQEIVRFENCSRPVRVIGSGAKLKVANGIKHGSFHPVTGAVYNPATFPFGDNDYKASAGAIVFAGECTASVIIEDLEIDGNIQNLALGGHHGANGEYQVPGYGVYIFNCTGGVLVRNVTSSFNGTDGVIVLNAGLTEASPATPVRLEGVICTDNGRQGLSLLGCKGFTAENCVFSRTGRTEFSVSPAAGVDIEEEDSIIRDVDFKNCEMSDNVGVGLVADTHDTAGVTVTRCRIIGTTNYAVWLRKPNITVDQCEIYGQAVNAYSTTDRGKATLFRRTLFSLKLAASPTGLLHAPGGYLCDFGGGDTGVVCDTCDFDTGGNSSGLLPFTVGGMTYRNCTFRQDSSSVSTLNAMWEGTNYITAPGGAAVNGIRRGPVILNGTTYTNSPSTELTVSGSTFAAAASGEGKMMGFAGSGLGLFGRGSIVDVNLGNYQGLTALGVPTGTTDVQLYGKLLFNDLAKVPDFADDTAAAAGGVALKQVYRTGSALKIRVA